MLLNYSKTVPIIKGLYPNSFNLTDMAYLNKLFQIFTSCLTPTTPLSKKIYLVNRINKKL